MLFAQANKAWGHSLQAAAVSPIAPAASRCGKRRSCLHSMVTASSKLQWRCCMNAYGHAFVALTPDFACTVLQGFGARTLDKPASRTPHHPQRECPATPDFTVRTYDWLSNLLRLGPGMSQSSPVQPDAEERTLREQYASPAAEGICVYPPLNTKV